MSLDSHHSNNPKLPTLIRELSSHFKSSKIDTYLDLGCGDGSFTLEIARIVGARNIYGVNVDEEALNNANTREIKVLKCNLSKDIIPLPDESLDLITALDVIEHLLNPDHMLKNPDHMLKKAYRLLRRGSPSYYNT